MESRVGDAGTVEGVIEGPEKEALHETARPFTHHQNAEGPKG